MPRLYVLYRGRHLVDCNLTEALLAARFRSFSESSLPAMTVAVYEGGSGLYVNTVSAESLSPLFAVA